MISMSTVKMGYRIAYEPMAYALENGSKNIREELKRKVRICSGAFQSISRLLPLFNFFKYGLFSFQYFSHRILRWTLAPLALFILIPSLTLLAFFSSPIYTALAILQAVFYLFAYLGWRYENLKVRNKIFFVPLYFTIMNYSVFIGFKRYILGKTGGHLWQKAKRLD